MGWVIHIKISLQRKMVMEIILIVEDMLILCIQKSKTKLLTNNLHCIILNLLNLYAGINFA